MKKKYLLLSLLAIGSCCVAVGCGESKPVPDAGQAYTPDYTHRYEAPTTDGVVLDGRLDESFWQGKAYFEQGFLSDANGTLPRMKITAVPKETGVYIGSIIYDTNVTTYNEDGAYALNKTTNWEIDFLNLAKGEDPRLISFGQTELRRRSMIVDAHGSFLLQNEGSFPNPGMYGAGKVYIEGEANGGNTEYISMEAFLPYESIGVDTTEGAPDKFYLLPTFRSVFPNSATVSRSQLGSFYPWAYATAFYAFDENGYTQATKEDSVLGNTLSGYPKTAGWDMRKESEGEAVMRGNTAQQIFFKDVYEKDLVMSADVELLQRPEAVFNLETESKLGFVYYDEYNNRQAIMLQGVNAATRKYDQLNVQLCDYEGNREAVLGKASLSASTNRFTLKVTKIGNTFTVYVNGQYVAQTTVDKMSGKVFPGLLTKNAEAKFSNYSCKAYDPAQEGEVGYTQKIYLQKADFSGFEEQPVLLNMYAKANESVALPTTYYAGGNYELDSATAGSVTTATVNADGSTELVGYYKRVITFVNSRANTAYLAFGASGVTLEADATVGKDGQRFNGFVISQGSQSVPNKDKIAIVFKEKEVYFQRNYDWDNDGISASNAMFKAGTIISKQTASAHILKATTPTRIKLVMANGELSIYADNTLYVKVNLEGLLSDLGMTNMNAAGGFDVGLYGYDCNVAQQDVTFRNISVSK